MPRQRLNAIALSDCRICDEVTSLHGYGFAPAEILRAIGGNVEAVARHIGQHAPHLTPILRDEINNTIARRKARP